ncbi:MAG: hypothetical protein RLZZ435_2559 [Cyanobacteriota bacterium]
MSPSHPTASYAELPITLYGNISQGEAWIERYRNSSAHLVCTLGFTATGLIPEISAAGQTSHDRRYTALADAEFLVNALNPPGGLVHYPLPPLSAGLSPVILTRALWETVTWPLTLFDVGLPETPSVPAIDVQGLPARCLSTGKAIPRPQVRRLLNQGMHWGEQLAFRQKAGYLVIGECVVGGTTTALGVLLGLGYDAHSRISSSHPTCNHSQKLALVEQGLRRANLSATPDPLDVLAAVGDPVQVFVAGLLLTASRQVGILLAGGTQMMAVYALAAHIAQYYNLNWEPEQILLGTTRWVVEDPTGDALGLLEHLGDRMGPPSLAVTQLSFAGAKSPALLAYEQGFVKEGMAAGGMAVAVSISNNQRLKDLQHTIYSFVDEYEQWRSTLPLDSEAEMD